MFPGGIEDANRVIPFRYSNPCQLVIRSNTRGIACVIETTNPDINKSKNDSLSGNFYKQRILVGHFMCIY